MAGRQSEKAMEKVQDMDSLSDDSVRSYKRPRRSARETMPGDGPEQQNAHGFPKTRDTKGWEHGIMIGKNREWMCKHCSMIGRSGGVTTLKQHLVGGTNRVRKCQSVPKHVFDEMKHLLNSKKWPKWTTRKGTVVQPAMATSHVPCSTPSEFEGSMMTPPHLEGAEEGTNYDENMFKLCMTRLVDLMLSAAEELNAEERTK